MSLGIAFKVPEGIVLAADSRVTLTNTIEVPEGRTFITSSYFDNSTKLLEIPSQMNFGMVTYGVGAILTSSGPRTAQSYIPEFEARIQAENMKVEDVATKWGEFLMEQYNSVETQPYGDMSFIIGGFDEGEAYGRLFLLHIPSSPEPQEWAESDFNLFWGGDTAIVQRIVNGFDTNLAYALQTEFNLSEDETTGLISKLKIGSSLPIPIVSLSLQDAVNTCVGLVNATIEAQSWSTAQRTVGGFVDVAIITRDKGFEFIQKKNIAVNTK